MQFKANDDQIRQLLANAVNASSPMGMGFLHATNKEFTSEDFNEPIEGDIHLDYVQGRMVKLVLFREGDGSWSPPDREPRSDYQSWVRQYPTYLDLIKSVPGVELL